MGVKSDGIIYIHQYPELKGDERAQIDDILQNWVRPNPNLRIGQWTKKPKVDDLWELPWLDIILLDQHLSTKDVEKVIGLVYKVHGKYFLNLELLNVMAVYKWVANEISEINKIVYQELGGEPDPDYVAAGIEQLKDFDYSVALDQLAQGDPLRYDQLLRTPYTVIFRKLCLDNVWGDIRKNYQEIVSRKAKRGRRKS
ncbi:MAG: hypothetical protein V2I33_24540 [Kangiellaceae bacterium]|jgi:hypothetical protein|nr:hypothetical protein [Kangiellaceae bacterium]